MTDSRIVCFLARLSHIWCQSLVGLLLFLCLLCAGFAAETNSVQASGLSADAMINLLQQRPDLLRAGKIRAAQQAGVDPGSITDDKLFDAIRGDAQLRDRIAQELQKQGYDTSATGMPAAQPAAPGTTPPAPGTTPDTNLSSAARNATVQQAVQKTDDAQDKQEESPAQNPVQQRTVPYSNLPSLADLYSQQLPPDISKLKRFGSEVFRVGTGNVDSLPMDLPAGPDYVLGPGDALLINVWGSQSQTLSQTIDRQGQIALPEAGTVAIAGMTIAQAQGAIQKALHTQFREMHVELSLGRVRTVRVYVVGDVQRPGAYDISSLSTPLNALYAAGGPTSVGSLRTLRHYRGKELVRELDLYDFLLRGVRSDIERLLPGDTILVPPVGPQVTVSGQVRRPAIYEVKGGEGLEQVLELAGGVLVSGSQQVNVERVEAHESRTMLSVRLSIKPKPQVTGGLIRPRGGQTEGNQGGGDFAIAGGNNQSNLLVEDTKSAQQLASFHAQDGDTVVVLPILPYNERSVYLDGHVYRPGKSPYREGMTINDLLRSYQDVMPEPADHVELIRLQAPDYRPTTITLNLSDVLRGNQHVPLQPFDVIRVFSRYEVDSPTVSIVGEVLRPGEYPLAEGMTASALLRMAGGFRRSAYREIADLASYLVQNRTKVLLKQSTIDLDRAMDGDRNADVLLKPGDVLSVRQITGWNDIGNTITLKGEVAHAGAYGIEEGERLSSVLKRAGGFRSEAYPEGAVLERVQVRELGERSRLNLIQRLQSQDLTSVAGATLSAQEQAQMLQTMRQQQQQALAALRDQPASGRLVINISKDMSKWENTTADVELRAGDVLTVPKRAGFVIVSGQVYNAGAQSYVLGKSADWYLRQSGGPTKLADKGDAYIVRANGSVISHGGLLRGGVLSTRLKPGDTLVVPERIIGGSLAWKSLLSVVQVMSSTAITAAVAAGL